MKTLLISILLFSAFSAQANLESCDNLVSKTKEALKDVEYNLNNVIKSKLDKANYMGYCRQVGMVFGIIKYQLSSSRISSFCDYSSWKQERIDLLTSKIFNQQQDLESFRTMWNGNINLCGSPEAQDVSLIDEYSVYDNKNTINQLLVTIESLYWTLD